MHLSKILDKNHQKIQRRDFIAKVTQGSTNLLIGSKMVKAESDKIIESQKDNPNEQESIGVWKNSFKQLSNNKLSNIQNKRIKSTVAKYLSIYLSMKTR